MSDYQARADAADELHRLTQEQIEPCTCPHDRRRPPDPDTRRARHVPALRTEGEDGVNERDVAFLYGRTNVINLTTPEREVTVAALHAYRSEVTHYLRTEAPDTSHDDCCPKAKAREAFRAERYTALQERLREIDGALQELDA